MKNKFNIGVIGKGFVGSAVANGFSEAYGYEANIRIYDKEPSRSLNSLRKFCLNRILFLFPFLLHQMMMVR